MKSKGEKPFQWALLLVGVTLSYNIIEALVALWAGVIAGSIALIGFGLDSIIESSASGILFWHLSKQIRGADPKTIAKTEHFAHRFVGGTFLALAVYIAIESGLTLYRFEAPEESLVGIALAGISLILMPWLAFKKMKVARTLESPALRAEAMETLICSCLSLILLLGLIANALLDWWWADPVAALLMIPWLVKEGLEGLRGEESCCE